MATQLLSHMWNLIPQEGQQSLHSSVSADTS